MEITTQILDDPELMAAYVEGCQRILHDEDRAAADRANAGCALAFLATLPAGSVPSWGTLPAELPAELTEAWTTAFDDQADDNDRATAARMLYDGLARAELTRAGEEILRRELG
ncbi:hypothetical protein [Antribacter gilvus]|uniref:hypothetical protein n=1 Tax=Antribacter gilvus TaxID=2304675 RepID=UPI0013DF96CC|nr:hypothetical protein [Antribacter gilvus]